MSELIVDDQYVAKIGSYYKNYALKLQLSLDGYVESLQRIKSEAVTSGEISNAIECFAQYAGVLRNTVSSMGNEIEATSLRYLEEIDEKDQYLY